MSIRILWSGPPKMSGMSERFEIRGTPAALAAIGTIMCDLTDNTMIKAHGGFGEVAPINLSGLKLILAPGDYALEFGHHAKALGLRADAARLKILGQSLINSYAGGDAPGHRIALRQSVGNTALAPTEKRLNFFSVAAEAPIEKSGWFDG